MEKQIFTNEVILSWLQYYAKNTTIDLEHVKIIDITKKNKNVQLNPTKRQWYLPMQELTIFFTACGMPGLVSVRFGTMTVQNRTDRF